jgi:hypothetical protein
MPRLTGKDSMNNTIADIFVNYTIVASAFAAMVLIYMEAYGIYQ